MQPEKEHKRKYAITVGGIFILLAVIGAITVAVFSIRLTSDLLDNQRQKNKFEDILTPVVMFDPTPFEKPEDIDNQRLLLYSMWTTLSGDNASSYKRSEENNTLLVPASDLEASAYKLFRDQVKLKHETFQDIETTYFYNEEINTYEVPTYGFLYVYRPQVTEIIKMVNDEYDIVVQYIPPENAWNSIYQGDGSIYDNKIMTFVMKKDGNDWYLLSIKNPYDDEIYQGDNTSSENDVVLGESQEFPTEVSKSETSSTSSEPEKTTP